MKFYARPRFRLGPLFFNFSATNGRPRFTSWGVKLWRWTWNFTSGQHSFDTPGPGYVKTARRRRR